jgi:hypothetical protein
MTPDDAPTVQVEVAVTPEFLRQVVVIDKDGRPGLARLIGPVNWFGSDRLTYTVVEDGD